MESADIIGSIWGCTPVPLAELRELNNGDAAQLTRLEAARIQNPEPKSEMSDWRPYANAETWREMIQRTSSALMKILSCDAKTTIVVGHGNSGQALIQARLELPLELEVSFQFDVASVTELRVNQWGEREIVRLNSIHDAWYLIRLSYSALWSEVNGVAFSIQCNMNSDTSIWSFRHLPLNLCDSRFGNAISHGWQSAACLFGVVAISFGSYNRRRPS